MWMSNQRSDMEGLLETQWRDHYTNEKEPASKLVFQAPDDKTKRQDTGINVQEEEEKLQDYMDEEVWLVTCSNCC